VEVPPNGQVRGVVKAGFDRQRIHPRRMQVERPRKAGFGTEKLEPESLHHNQQQQQQQHNHYQHDEHHHADIDANATVASSSVNTNTEPKIEAVPWSVMAELAKPFLTIDQIAREKALNVTIDMLPQLGPLFLKVSRHLPGDQVKYLVLFLAGTMSGEAFKVLLLHIEGCLPLHAHKALVRYVSKNWAPNFLKLKAITGVATRYIPQKISRNIVRYWLKNTASDTVKRTTLRAIYSLDPQTAEYLVKLAYDHVAENPIHVAVAAAEE